MFPLSLLYFSGISTKPLKEFTNCGFNCIFSPLLLSITNTAADASICTSSEKHSYALICAFMLSVCAGNTVTAPTKRLLPSNSKSINIGPAPEPVPPPAANTTKRISHFKISSICSAILSKSSITSCFALFLSLLHPSPPVIWYLCFAFFNVSKSSCDVFRYNTEYPDSSKS